MDLKPGGKQSGWGIPPFAIVQKNPGEANITTTEIYLHVAKGVHGLGVVSPLDGAEA